jgi:hypothetical protein
MSSEFTTEMFTCRSNLFLTFETIGRWLRNMNLYIHISEVAAVAICRNRSSYSAFFDNGVTYRG